MIPKNPIPISWVLWSTILVHRTLTSNSVYSRKLFTHLDESSNILFIYVYDIYI